MSRASEYARRLREASLPLFRQSGKDGWTAKVTETGELFIAGRTEMTSADVQRFIAWLRNVFEEQPF